MFRDLLTDPVAGKLSSARAIGLAYGLASIAFAFIYPDRTATLAALLGACLTALGLRKRAEGAP